MNTNEHDHLRDELRSFGRRRARTFTAHQQSLVDRLLPQYRLDISANGQDAERLPGHLAAGASEAWLEIGFGGGEHLVWQAARNPNVVCVGCEPFVDGLVKVLSQIESGGPTNIRLHDDDARDVLRWLPDASIARAFILFPDPWPKTRHHKRRLVSAVTLQLLARVMRPGAELRIATDIGDYVRTTMLAFADQSDFQWTAQGPLDWREQGDDWPVTRYQQKAMRERRRCYFLRFTRL